MVSVTITKAALLGAMFTTLASADFYIYQTTKTYLAGEISGTAWGYLFSGGPIDCPSVVNGDLVFQGDSDDVSGSKKGVRCKGCFSGQDLPHPSLIEWNNDMGHFTAYADRSWAMVDTHNNVKGTCSLTNTLKWTCTGDSTVFNGNSLIFCTSEFNADSINHH
ncbi:hypothetical protein F4778DRAFT_747759 [Xylariomycetidae sp. FL2044]|nr:hypothetical protein F4778DRAFT_747759 [Xylariomycetidae sp. FL2044]